MKGNALQHYGVMGMKWGTRRSANTLSINKNKNGSRAEAREARRNPEKSLSDDELRNKINRLQMEKQFKQLTKELDTSAVARGERCTTSIMKGVGTIAVTSSAVVTLYNNSKTIRGIVSNMAKK